VEKLDLLCFLSIPRLLQIMMNNTKMAFIFRLSPSKYCHKSGIEHYIFHWNEVMTNKTVGSIDILQINHCTLKTESCFQIAYQKSNKNMLNSLYEVYELFANQEDCLKYVKALNYLSQLIKCKVYAMKSVRK
jgi:hypothetical protein